VLRIPAFLIAFSLCGAALAQGGVTVLRGPGEAKPDPGVSRTPPGSAAPTTTTGPRTATPPGSLALPQPLGRGDSGLAPPPDSGPIAQALGGAKPLTAAEAAAFKASLTALDLKDYAAARANVANFPQPLLHRYVEWSVLRVAPRSDAEFGAIWKFLRENPDWPEPEVLRRQAEDRIPATMAAAEVWRYFQAFPPLTSQGLIRRLEVAEVTNPAELAKLAGESWRTGTFREADQSLFLQRWSQHLNPADEVARFDRLMRENRLDVATNLTSRLPPAERAVAAARLAMAQRAPDTEAILRGVPAPRLAEAQLRLERARWLRRGGNLDEAKAIFLAPPPTQSEEWWTERHQLARDLLAAKRPADAYAVAVPHGQTRGVAFAEAEFLAGWIALRHLKRAEDAVRHFQKLHVGVATDISKSRAAYWLGRAHETAGRAREGQDWYRRAAAAGHTYYGQLAARRLPGGAARLPGDPTVNDSERQSLGARELAQVARHLAQAGDSERTRPFLLRLARLVQTPGETALLAQLAVELRRPDIGVSIARRAVENGITLFDASFPVVETGPTGSIERALVLGLMRQESAFHSGAISSAGARGLMQLMPATAREVAGRLGQPYSQERLTADPVYNVALGSQYMAEMLNRFGGSYELSLAAYNAGPSRVARWLETIGDPRGGTIDMVDWIEMIPFRETRNYVQRVMEGVGVYRDRLNGPFRAVPPATGR